MVKVSIEVDVYNMKDGKLVDFFFDGKLYQEIKKMKDDNNEIIPIDDDDLGLPLTGEIKSKIDPIVSEIKQKFIKKAPKRYLNMIDKWIRDKNITSFTEDDFFKTFTGRAKEKKYHDLFKDYISKMVGDGSVLQWHDNSFKVVNNKQKG